MKLIVAVFAVVAAAEWDRGGGEDGAEATWQDSRAGARGHCRYASDGPTGDTQEPVAQPSGNSLFSHLVWNSEHFGVFAPQCLSSDSVGGGQRLEEFNQLPNGASCWLSPACVCRGTHSEPHSPAALYDLPRLQTEDICVLTEIRQRPLPTSPCLQTDSTSDCWLSNEEGAHCGPMDKEECRQWLTSRDSWDHAMCNSNSSALPLQCRTPVLSRFLVSTELLCSGHPSTYLLRDSENKGTGVDSISIAEEADSHGSLRGEETWLEMTAGNYWENASPTPCFSKSLDNLYSDLLLNIALPKTLPTCVDSRVCDVWESAWVLGDSLDTENYTWRLAASELSMLGSVLSAFGLLLICAQEAAPPAVSPVQSPPAPLRKVRKLKSLSVKPVSHRSPAPPARKDDCERRTERSSTAATEEETEYLDDYKTRPGLFGGFSYID